MIEVGVFAHLLSLAGIIFLCWRVFYLTKRINLLKRGFFRSSQVYVGWPLQFLYRLADLADVPIENSNINWKVIEPCRIIYRPLFDLFYKEKISLLSFSKNDGVLIIKVFYTPSSEFDFSTLQGSLGREINFELGQQK